MPASSSLPDAPTELSKKYETSLGIAHTTMQALKDRIRLHYDLASDYYLNLWGEHIHHGYWPTPESKNTDSKETAQVNLIKLLLDISQLSPSDNHPNPNGGETMKTSPPSLRILDVGCGLGGTSRYLASTLGAAVTGITISGKQVQMATRLSKKVAAAAPTGNVADISAAAADDDDDNDNDDDDDDGFIPLAGGGKVRFLELDAEKMGEHFSGSSQASGSDGDDSRKFDIVWITEALSHFPDKGLFFRNAQSLLRKGGKLVLADWFKAEGLEKELLEKDIKPIEDGMLLPPLCTQQQYVELGTDAGLEVLSPPKDISQDVSKTWEISWSLVQNPSLWAFAFSQGRDGIAFLQAFRAMRRGYANGSFRYAVMAFKKP